MNICYTIYIILRVLITLLYYPHCYHCYHCFYYYYFCYYYDNFISFTIGSSIHFCFLLVSINFNCLFIHLLIDLFYDTWTYSVKRETWDVTS